MKILVTGGLGELGSATATELLRQGHEVVVFDRPSRKARAAARRLPRTARVWWGDVRDAAEVEAACRGVDAVVHGAAILAPDSELAPALTEAVNVGGTRHVLEALSRGARGVRLVFLSSVSVYGARPDDASLRRADEPLVATDCYTSSKIEGEALVRTSDLAWTILRLGVSLRPGLGRASRAALRLVFDIHPDTRVEVVHPEEVALAIARCVEVQGSTHKTLLIGGGPSCRIRHFEMLSGMLSAAGLGPVQREHFGSRAYYTDWLDTTESQALLGYQRRSFTDMQAEAQRVLWPLRALLWPVRHLARRFVLSHSPRGRAT